MRVGALPNSEHERGRRRSATQSISEPPGELPQAYGSADEPPPPFLPAYGFRPLITRLRRILFALPLYTSRLRLFLLVHSSRDHQARAEPVALAATRPGAAADSWMPSPGRLNLVGVPV